MLESSSSGISEEQRKRSYSGTSGSRNVLSALETSLSPLVAVFSLWFYALWYEGGVYPEHFLLAVLVFSITFPGTSRLSETAFDLLVSVVRGWALLVALLFVAGLATGYLRSFPEDLLLSWVVTVPLVETAAWFVLKKAAPGLLKLSGPRNRALVVGMNSQGLELASNLKASPLTHIELVGFVDDRSAQRLGADGRFALLGRFDHLPDLIRTQRINQIYISLPMASQPRILKILEDLKDTTVSIYFVPDMFVTDLIQSKPTVLCGVPVISVCETPFQGLNGLLKRSSDILLSSLILVLLAPLLLGIGIAVKLGSAGPAIFKQRRYGQDGQEILVYKFRSMTVAEDGPQVKQAQRGDSRITPLGRILRKTSLDELPQFVNVLQGRMSIVGPRPHAVAHNELYRKLIKGYMIRHKVKPGITGWAQVNGFRGETDTLEKMQGRIDHDLDYLRNWSLKLDMLIVFKTIRLMFKDSQAY